MTRKTSIPMTRTHIWLFDEDIERLHKYFDQSIGFSNAARHIIHSYLNSLEARAQAIAASTPSTETKGIVMEFLVKDALETPVEIPAEAPE